MKCLHCHKNDVVGLTAEESPNGRPFTLGLCKECLTKVIKAVMEKIDKE